MTRTPPQTPQCRRVDLLHVLRTTLGLVANGLRLLWLFFQPQARLAARCLVVEKEIALYLERKVQPRRFDDAGRITLALLSTFADLKDVVVAVKPSQLVRWKKGLWALYWRWKSRPRGRRRIPKDVQQLIAEMSRDNPTWGQERIHDELVLKLGIKYCPRAIRKYMHKDPGRGPGRTVSRERWSTFVRNHIHATLACDFFTEVTLGFATFYVFVLMELGTRRILHANVTRHPTAEWTAQQLRDAIPGDHPYRFLIHDRDAIFSPALDTVVSHMGVRVLKTPVRAPKANAFCERLIGTIRRECLDFFLVVNERHLRRILKDWVRHYNQGRPHSSLGPGIPDPPSGLPASPADLKRIPDGYRVAATPVLAGLHHEYRLEKIAA